MGVGLGTVGQKQVDLGQIQVDGGPFAPLAKQKNYLSEEDACSLCGASGARVRLEPANLWAGLARASAFSSLPVLL